MRKTYYFNTGVKPYEYHPSVKIGKGQILAGDVLVVPFDCDDVPGGARFLFACDSPTLINSNDTIVRKMYNTALLSKYAYFKLTTTNETGTRSFSIK